MAGDAASGSGPVDSGSRLGRVGIAARTRTTLLAAYAHLAALYCIPLGAAGTRFLCWPSPHRSLRGAFVEPRPAKAVSWGVEPPSSSEDSSAPCQDTPAGLASDVGHIGHRTSDMSPFQGCCAHDHDCEASDCSSSYSLYKYIDMPRVSEPASCAAEERPTQPRSPRAPTPRRRLLPVCRSGA